MRRLQNFKKKNLASHTVDTLCLSFDTSFGIITFIAWSKRRKII